MKKRIMTIKVTAVILIGMTSCKPGDQESSQQPRMDQQSRANELTRGMATEILHKYFETPRADSVGFRKDMVEKAIADKMITKTDANFGGFVLSIDPQNEPPNLRPVLNPIEHGIGGQTNNSISLNGIYGIDPPALNFKKLVREELREVSGIAPGTSPNHKDVDCVTTFLLPDEAEPLAVYLYSGAKHRLRFVKYDDGWRIQE